MDAPLTVAAQAVPDLRDDYPGGRCLHPRPAIWVFDDAASAAECDHVRRLAEPIMVRARVSRDGGGEASAGRTNDVAWLPHDTDAVTRAIIDRYAERVGLPASHAESFQVIRYGQGQEYRAHFDAYDLRTARGQRCTARGGQRLVTTLTYLCDVEAGGGTGFPRLGVEVEPARGRMVLFHNCAPGTTDVDRDSLHAGLPVERGEKWAFNLWFRVGPYR